MRCSSFRVALLVFALSASTAARAADACVTPPGALGVSRTVEIDTSAGPMYGAFTKLHPEPSLLGPKEVILTFDDGPMPWITQSILDTLDRHCVKATFFSVGQMAIAYPAYVKEVVARGHTLGTHTWSHPLNLRSLSLDKAINQIDRGFAAVAAAADAPPAPFFRFPGLSDSPAMMAHLKSQGIAAFTVDVVSNDSYIRDPQRLIDRTLREIERANGGIVLFHDIKASTAKALPAILDGLASRGFKIVHMTAKAPVVPDAALLAAIKATMKPADATAVTVAASGQLAKPLPFFGSIGPDPVAASAARAEPGRGKIRKSRKGTRAAHGQGHAKRHGGPLIMLESQATTFINWKTAAPEKAD